MSLPPRAPVEVATQDRIRDICSHLARRPGMGGVLVLRHDGEVLAAEGTVRRIDYGTLARFLVSAAPSRRAIDDWSVAERLGALDVESTIVAPVGRDAVLIAFVEHLEFRDRLVADVHHDARRIEYVIENAAQAWLLPSGKGGGTGGAPAEVGLTRRFSSARRKLD